MACFGYTLGQLPMHSLREECRLSFSELDDHEAISSPLSRRDGIVSTTKRCFFFSVIRKLALTVFHNKNAAIQQLEALGTRSPSRPSHIRLLSCCGHHHHPPPLLQSSSSSSSFSTVTLTSFPRSLTRFQPNNSISRILKPWYVFHPFD